MLLVNGGAEREEVMSQRTVGKISESNAKSASCSVPAGSLRALKSAKGTLTYSYCTQAYEKEVKCKGMRTYGLATLIWTHGNVAVDEY